MKEIAKDRDEKLKRKEQEFNYKRDKIVGVIEDALFPFASVNYSFEKGFYKSRPDGSMQEAIDG